MLRRLHPRRLAGSVTLAAFHRSVFRRVRFVGVTGSCGKTMTTTLVATVLARRDRVRNGAVLHRLNSRGRTARTILGSHPLGGYCVAELSGHAPGMLSHVGKLRPDIGVVTHIRSDHRTNYESLDETAQEKGRLVEALSSRGLAVLNADDPLVWAMRERTRARVLGYGTSEEADVRLVETHVGWPDRLTVTLDLSGLARALPDRVADGARTVTIRTRFLTGTATAPVMAATAVGLAEGIPVESVAEAIEGVEPVPGRMSPEVVPGGVTFVDDAWKAPVYSLEPILEFLASARASRKILVLGSLSDHSGKGTRVLRKVVRKALAVADVVAYAGPWWQSLERVRPSDAPDRLLLHETLETLNRELRSFLRPDDLVVLKGSARADHLERLHLDAREPVACWRDRCGRSLRCTACPELRRAESPD